jgi:pyruvate dehydrogenase E2 component (dihydrolipoamide acetyltransferase)
MEEATVLQWLVAEGDRVEVGQPLAEIETDKATVTFEADSAGVILALSVSEGATVPLGAPIAVIGEAGEVLSRAESPEAVAAVSSASPTPAPPVPPQPVTALPTRGGRPHASPLARRLAAQLDVSLEGVAGSGPHGRITRADVERAAAEVANGSRTAPVSTPPSAAHEGVVHAKGEITIHELTRIQRTVGRRMAESRATVPDFELRCLVDMSEVVSLRDRLREVTDPLPSYNDFIVKATALALREFPRVNGAYRDGKVETYSRINVGIAVAADEALVVPTIFETDRLSLGEIGRKSRELAARVRDGSIAPAEAGGGTFTVSNLGMYGVDSFSAVINPPQAAILAVGSLKPRALVDEQGNVVARPTIGLTLACDHRVLYGADGARFLTRVRELLEHPNALML